MMNRIIIVFIFISVTSLFSAEKVKSVTARTAITFNILCAKCHEGECSGRLSFATGSTKAKNHIQHYAGDTNLSNLEIKEFFTLLNHMKTKCALQMPKNEISQEENLSIFAIPSHKGYFIPLGKLTKNDYILNIKTKEYFPFRIEVLSSNLDQFADQFVEGEKESHTIHFTIKKTADTFLRIRSQRAIHLLSIKYKSAAQ